MKVFGVLRPFHNYLSYIEILTARETNICLSGQRLGLGDSFRSHSRLYSVKSPLLALKRVSVTLIRHIIFHLN